MLGKKDAILQKRTSNVAAYEALVVLTKACDQFLNLLRHRARCVAVWCALLNQ